MHCNVVDNRGDFGFIMTRHVRSESHAKLWIECYNSIRKFYNNMIMIIDDDSDSRFINFPTSNVCVVNTKFKGAGEILPYYYFYHFHPFRKAVVLHDSMFIQRPFTEAINSVPDVKFLWHFREDSFDSGLLYYLHNYQSLIGNTSDVNGCFGTASVITWDFLKDIQQQYNFLNLVNVIKTRPQRMDLERLFGILCTQELKRRGNRSGQISSGQISLFGSIFDHVWAFGIDFDAYKNKRAIDQYVVKVWTGR